MSPLNYDPRAMVNTFTTGVDGTAFKDVDAAKMFVTHCQSAFEQNTSGFNNDIISNPMFRYKQIKSNSNSTWFESPVTSHLFCIRKPSIKQPSIRIEVFLRTDRVLTHAEANSQATKCRKRPLSQSEQDNVRLLHFNYILLFNEIVNLIYSILSYFHILS